MTLTIATLSLCIFIVLSQHLYNWGMRMLWNIMKEAGLVIYFVITILMVGFTYTLFQLLIEINK